MCAYNPGVQSVGGDYIMQGMSSLGKGIGSAIKQYRQNEQMRKTQAGKWQAFIDQANSNPAAQKTLLTLEAAAEGDPDASSSVTPEVAKAFGKVKSGKAGVMDFAALTAYADTQTELAKEEQQRQMRDQQMKLLALQTQAANQEIMARQQAQAALAQAAAPRSEMGTAIQQGSRFEQLGGMSATPSDPSMMEVWRRFATSGAPVTPEVERFINAGLQAEAKQEATQARIAAMGAKPKELDVVTIYDTDEKGNPVRVSIDKATGKPIGKPSPITQPKYYPTPEEAAQTEGLKKEAELRATTASKFVTDIADKAEVARSAMGDIDAITKLYESGAKSGFGQPFVTSARSALQAVGIGDPLTLANQQLLETKLRERALGVMQSFNQGQGAVSNYERQIFEKAIANAGLTKEANLALLQALKAVGERAIKLDDERLQLREKGVSESAIQTRLERMRQSMPIPGIQALANVAQRTPEPARESKATPAKEKQGFAAESILNKYGVK